ncbi:threonine aldolase family protein [Methylocapsa palsarum]|uniref:Threonine aldolase n=1 Tax=Methylocapsa palsarum TaxID=1612308 RepID=A0A1I4ARY6_9HYPH|nr:beta-eliminating lyase-related protein [Methylocapsa palsarum]SFK58651.1 threonine aldolase [Methylocapsa palsarum]
MAFLASDNTSNVSPEIMEALNRANIGHARPYGADEYTFRLTEQFRLLFQHDELLAFPVFNGSAANSAALASLVKPYELVVGHHYSHIGRDECGMPEFFTGGKILGVSGDLGKIDLCDLDRVLRLASHAGVHHSRPRAVSVTQSTEVGTIYSIEEIEKISAVAKEHDLHLHMDGARFANAVSSLGCRPADMTWKCGVDVLSFGGTKNGDVGGSGHLL